MSRVLLIDDDRGTLESSGWCLRAAGYQTDLAADGRTGIQIAKDKKCDLALIDLYLPDMSGLEVAAAMKGLRPTPVIILTTAFPEPSTATSALELELDGYVPGLLFLEEILEVVAETLARRGLRDCKASAPVDALSLPVDSRLLTAVGIMQAEPAESSLTRLAERVGLSESYLRHRFKDGIGIPISRFAATARLVSASRRLLTSRDPISKVAAACGWTDPRHFRSVFRSRFRMTPTSYRERFAKAFRLP